MFIYFKPDKAELSQIVKAIKRVLSIKMVDAVNAAEIGRIECDKEHRDALVKAIENAGAKLV